MTPSIEARDFPVSAKLRRSGDGSPDPPNRQANLDTCHTCTHYNPYRHRPHLGITPEPHCHQNPTNTHPCPHYEPAHQSTKS